MAHELDEVGRAVDVGEAGGLRVVARCRCGWRTRAALTAKLAIADLDDHLVRVA